MKRHVLHSPLNLHKCTKRFTQTKAISFMTRNSAASWA